MDTVKKDKVIKPRNLIKNDVVLKTYKIYNYKYKRTPERVATVNRCYLSHLLVWWDADMLIYQDGVLHIKEHPEVIIFDEGSYNLITFEYLSVFDTLKSPLISTFISSKNTKPRWLNLLSTICFEQKGRFNL